ncbi:MAG: CapA family protein, partial [Bacteroidota bacterium]
SYLPPDDGKKLLAPVITYLAAADVTFGNMEGTILSGQGIPKQCKDPSLCYVFKSPDHYVDYFKEAGFDLLSVANNHSGDFGKPGKDNTVRLLNDRGIAFAGFSDHPTAIIEKNGLKIGLCAFAPNSGTVNINDHKTAKEIVRNLAKSCDIVIVSFHGGAEGAGHTHITRKTETFYGENRGNPYLFAREVIDAGADVVLGHGPHVTRAFDVYQGRFIAYSMGNFATYGRFNLKGSAGLAPIVNIKINSDGSFIEGRVISTEQKGEGGPLIDPDGKVLKEIINLTKTDIPEVPLIFSDDGTFRMK